ncbi:MFS transporter [Chitiniphilus eburneus]|uniref:MFS transporter n=1 Tax=Chitiniphilus eburneus TaxID=2571148 RepID=A0A4V5MS77_9NEIS|nr:MFS transporter [Chitiniphilus eburneus]TJZ79018.1 MFS transporter [Chitiniphilus eburneus]
MTPLPHAFRRLAGSNLASQSAQQIGLAAAPLVAVLALGSDVTGTGLLQVAQTLPFLLLAVPLGVVADRTSRRGMMALGELTRASSFVAIVLLAWFGGLNLWLLALLSFIATVGAVAYSVATPALIPAVVPRGALAQANGRIELVRSLALTAGPALGGVLVGWTGASPAFAMAAALSLCAAGALSGLPDGAPPSDQPRRNFSHELREGAGFALRQPLLRAMLLTASIFNIAYFVLQTVYVPYAVRHLGLSGTGVGVTLAAYGGGMVLSALLVSHTSRSLSPGAQMRVAPLGAVAAALAMLATLWWPSPWLAGACFFLIGAGSVIWTVATTTLRQAVTPHAMLGRVSSINTLATYGARPLGAALAAGVGFLGGEKACLGAAVACFMLQAALVLASPLSRLRTMPG